MKHSVFNDHYFMRIALNMSLRSQGNSFPNPSVGAVIVKDNNVISTGWTQPGGRPHAEIVALNKNKEKNNNAILYTTLEPCSHFGKTAPCVDAIIKSKIKRVVIAIKDPNPQVNGRSIKKLKRNNVQVKVGVLKKEAENINLGFFKKIKKNQINVNTKIATSKNGKMTNPNNKWITSELARSYGHFLRAKHDAIASGINTIMNDNPLLTCRLPGMEKFSPIRIIFDTKLKIKKDLRVVKTAKKFKTIIFTSNQSNKMKINILKKKGLEIVFIKNKTNSINIEEAMNYLIKIGINNVLLETGPKLNKSFFNYNLINKIFHFESKQNIKLGGISFYKVLKIKKIKDLKFKINSYKDLINDNFLTYTK